MNYLWAVWKNNRFAGYIESPSETDALRIASQKYGKSIFLVRMSPSLC